MDPSLIVAPSFALAGTILGAYINKFSSRKKYMRERVWEARKDAYSQVVGKLHNIAGACDIMVAQFIEDAVGFNSSDSSGRLIGKMWENWFAATDAVNKNLLIVSKDFLNVFNALSRSVDGIMHDQLSKPEVVEAMAKCAGEAIAKLTPIGARDLLMP